MNSTDCLPEPALWPATAGEHLAPAIAAHLRQCASCAARVTQLREQRRQLSAPADTRQPDASTGALDVAAISLADARNACDVPERIGGYRVLRLLCLGGQAEVYLARHPTLGANVVVKWAHATLQRSPGTARRFAEEAQLLARLRHPNLVRVYDVGIAEGRPFLVMEHVAGRALSSAGARQFPPRDAAAIVATIARALQAVHDAGRLHLDVQPDNILIDGDGAPRLIDFGMAARRGGEPADPNSRPPGGTPEYMSPELLAGDVARIDVQADIYALGAVLHELLTGSPPQPECLWAGTHAVWQRDPGAAPRALRRACRRALDPEPARRFSTALDFARALERSAGASSGSFARIAAALVVLTVLSAGLWSLANSDDHVAPASTESAVVPGDLAGAVRQFLARTSGEHESVHIYLQNGRRVPVRVEPQTHVANRPQPARIRSITRDLLALRGTSLVAVLPGAPGNPVSAAHVVPPGIAPLPQLPAGTMAHVTARDISVLACGASPAARSTATLLTHQLRRVQAELLRVSPQFDALLFASGAGTDPPAVSANRAP